MWVWIVVALLAVMAVILAYACCSVAGEADRRSEEQEPGKGQDDA